MDAPNPTPQPPRAPRPVPVPGVDMVSLPPAKPKKKKTPPPTAGQLDRRLRWRGRLPDGSRVDLRYDGAAEEWTGTLTVPTGPAAAVVFTARRRGQFTTLVALDDRYREWLARPAAVPPTLCPACGGDLVRVTRSGKLAYLNDDQWESQKAGDYYCARCPSNGRGVQDLCYWWEHELVAPPAEGGAA